MKRFIVGFSMVSILAMVAAARADITIGMNVSTTGPAASLGIPEKNSLALGPSVIAGQKVRYIVYDDATDTTTAVQNAKRLVSSDKVDLLLGPSTTPTCLAVLDIAAESKTPMIAFASSTVLISPVDAKRRWIFKVTPNDDLYADAMINHMVQKGVKSVSVIAVDDPYGEVNTVLFKKYAAPKGISVLTVEKYARTDTSATAQVLHAMKGNPDAVYIISAGTPAALPHITLIDRGYKGKIYQAGGAANADFLRVGGKAVEGGFTFGPPVLVAEQLPDGYPTKSEALKFLTTFEPKFGPRSIFSSFVWDAMRIVEAAVPKALKSAQPGTEKFREALRTAIEETKGLRGAGAVYNMSATEHSGINQLGMTVIQIENGKWKLVQHADFK